MPFYQNRKKVSVSVSSPEGFTMVDLLQYDWFESCDPFYERISTNLGLTKVNRAEDLLPKPQQVDHDYLPKVRETYLRTLSSERLQVIARGLNVPFSPSEHRDELIARIVRRW